MAGENIGARTCVLTTPGVFVRLLGKSVPICSGSFLKSHIQHLSKTLGFPSNEETTAVSAQDRKDEDAEGKAPVGATRFSRTSVPSGSASLDNNGDKETRICRAKLRRAVLSPTFLAHMSSHFDSCSTAPPAAQSERDLDDACLAWSSLLWRAIGSFWETEGGEPCCPVTRDGVNASVSDVSENEDDLHNSMEDVIAGLAQLVNIEQALDALLSAVEAVVASPFRARKYMNICTVMLKQIGDALDKRLSPVWRGASSSSKSGVSRPANDGGVQSADETGEKWEWRGRRRIAVCLLFTRLPSLICSIAHFVAASARPPPGEPSRCLLSSPSCVNAGDTASLKLLKEQIGLYEKGLLTSLDLIRTVILDEAERYHAPVEEFESNLVEKVICICTPTNMKWKSEKSSTESNRTKSYESLLPSSLRRYELVFGDADASVAGTSKRGVGKRELPDTRQINPERSIRDATLRVAALIEALMIPLQSLGFSGSAPPAQDDFPLADAWRSPTVTTLGAEILQVLRKAVNPSVSPSFPTMTHQQFLSEGNRTRLICRTCSLLLSCKQLPRAFDGSKNPYRRQMLSLELAVDVAAAQAETSPDSFRDKISGIKCLPDGLADENVPQHATAFCRTKGDYASIQNARKATWDFASHLGDTGAMLLCFMVARVFHGLLLSLAEHEATDYSRLTIPVLLRLVDIPQPSVRRLGWTCLSIASSLLSPSDALAFQSPLLRAIHDGFPICNEIPTCVEDYMSAVVSALKVLFPDPTESYFLAELQFLTNMCIVTLGQEPPCLASFMRHFRSVVKRAGVAAIYIAKDLIKIGLRGVESLTPVAIIEGIALIRQLFVELGVHSVSYVPEVLCRLVMIYITFVSPAVDCCDHQLFKIVGTDGNAERLTETQRLHLENESVLLIKAIRANCTADEYARVVACLRCTCLQISSVHEAHLCHHVQEFRAFCMRCAPL
ncbi:hypothetical protein TGDOM2_318640 [Toxoplasma gondii GAB2-2007-GAL-DOM2]|uniref:Uncharacterized protein n=4 Tax=Toxoplasma gondii TaxID=5811 RepID=V5B1H1_TOXGV|nr:hypothetical protein TGVEG_318640 [Toxoplasma gondii VEG]KFG31042.1 hypothetical protein TGDOM2_318640 [Toxoplasma gondii GAB2-2007-GAL-DOM2]KFG43558.1 hypothetical protein TGP89_318640 [Toxoplasma gondii p89]PUA88426.1 hypothetical protein TGBR9_318640 [Toxoplasma gondii TgCATBr9]